MRTLVRTVILEKTDELSEEDYIPDERWYGSGSTGDTPPRPFAEIRFGGRFPGMASVRRRRVEVWVHDDEGDYDRIERILAFLKRTLNGLEHRSDGAGTEIVSMSWVNDSTDLYDDGYRTFCMSSTFELIGKETP